MKRLRYFFEAMALYALFFGFGLLSPARASDIGGWIGRTIGPRLASSRKALRNLERALPDLCGAEKARIIKGMWENLGRIVAEYPHLEALGRDHTKVLDEGLLDELFEKKQAAIFFGAHFGNWELNAPAVFLQYSAPVDVSYRAPNNPWVDRLLGRARSMKGGIAAHAKSREGGRAMMKAVKSGHSLGILIDQKYNQGLSLPFFGIEAMTNPFFVQLAQKYRCPLVPIRNTRLGGARFELHVFKPIEVFEDNGEKRPLENVIAEAHILLEEWIREKPEQWLWLHKRWPNDMTAK